MTKQDLVVLTERLLNQLEWQFGAPEGSEHFVVLTEGDRTLYIETDELEDAQGATWPVLVLWVPLLHDVEVEAADFSLLSELNGQAPIGNVVLSADDQRLIVVHQAVGWPGAAEYRAAMEMLVASAMYVKKHLAHAVSGSAPPKYSELVR